METIIPGNKEKGVVLSFDVESWSNLCGGKYDLSANPEDEYGHFLPRLLDVLDSYNVKAQFFICGKVVELYPFLFRSLVQKGHGLGGHGYEHEVMPNLRISEQMTVVNRVKKTMKQVLGISPISWRCPGLAANLGTYVALRNHGFRISSNAIRIDKPFSVKGIADIPLAEKMDGDFLGFYLPITSSGIQIWADYMKKEFDRISKGILVLGMHTWVQRKYDPRLEAIRSFLTYVEPFMGEVWMGRLDDLQWKV
ncbi:MAG: polysaccharide deacetylase family protein [Nitrososphaerales archaeon]|nr:polysaccharide deacetylase family protein [Nitrososphaerales archaeon]